MDGKASIAAHGSQIHTLQDLQHLLITVFSMRLEEDVPRHNQNTLTT